MSEPTTTKKRPPRPKKELSGFRPFPADLYAARRLKQLLGLELDAQVLRLGLHYVLSVVERCETVDEAQGVLGDALVRVLSIRRGRPKKKPACAPPTVGMPEAPASIAAA